MANESRAGSRRLGRGQLLLAAAVGLLGLGVSLTAAWFLRGRWPEPPRAIGPEQALLKRAGLLPLDRAAVAPPLELTDTGGHGVTLADLRGRWVLVNFWGTTCPPCLGKLPALARLAGEFSGRGVVVLAVCVDEPDAETVQRVRQRYAPALPLYVDGDGRSRLRYDAGELPTVCLIDRDGRLRARGPGPDDWSGAAARELLTTLSGEGK